jgi:hypothetical protein
MRGGGLLSELEEVDGRDIAVSDRPMNGLKQEKDRWIASILSFLIARLVE